MGYYTEYKLKLSEHKTEPGKTVDLDYVLYQFRKECEGARCSLTEDGRSSGSTKWYDSTEDLKAFSKKYPTVLFELSGEGEESGDIWMEYFLNGKSQRCGAIITYEKFDENKMK